MRFTPKSNGLSFMTEKNIYKICFAKNSTGNKKYATTEID